jgi:hypothetical protein
MISRSRSTSFSDFTAGSSLVVESQPFVLGLDRTTIAWQVSVEPWMFHIIETDGILSLSDYRVRPSLVSEDITCLDYQIVGEVSELVPPPAVGKQDGSIGVK